MDVKALKFEPALKYKHLEHSPVAFFCAEYALDNEFTTYAGGLGVLAGDFVLEAVDEGLPLVALGLKYGSQSNVDDNVGHFSLLKQEGTPVVIEVPYGESSFKAQVWVRCLGQSVYLFLLDSRVDDNLSNDQVINAHLYDTDSVIRIKQEMLLGIGGVKLLTQIGLTPSVYHLNEGHTAFAGFELLVNHHRTEVLSETLTLIKKKIVATKHTIFPLAGSNMGEDELTRIVGPYCDKNKLSVGDVFQLGKYRNNGSLSHVFSTTQFMLNCLC
jgi:alpha-glucan phosphorylase-like protein